MGLSPEEIHKKLMELGVSDLDAGLVVNCINRKSAYTWLNTDPVSAEQINAVNTFMADNELGVKIELSEVPYQGKFIWDVKVPRKAEPQPTQMSQAELAETNPSLAKKLGPEGRFKSLSELGL